MQRTCLSLSLTIALAAVPGNASAQELAAAPPRVASAAPRGEEEAAYTARARAPRTLPERGPSRSYTARAETPPNAGTSAGRTAPVGESSSAGPTTVASAAPTREPELDWDPLESVNRGVFAVNDAFDRYLLEPAAQAWTVITPTPLRSALGRFFVHLEFPSRLLGCLAQGRLVDSGEEIGRFVINSTAGVAGLFDPAARIGLEPNPEDLGQAFGVWGVGSGPYLMLPLLGPTTTRDLINLPLESAASLVPGLGALNAVNTRAGLIVELREARIASLDYYSFVRSAYLQRRRALVRNERPGPQEIDDDLYEIGDDLD